jgi:hypothetical protein
VADQIATSNAAGTKQADTQVEAAGGFGTLKADAGKRGCAMLIAKSKVGFDQALSDTLVSKGCLAMDASSLSCPSSRSRPLLGYRCGAKAA